MGVKVNWFQKKPRRFEGNQMEKKIRHNKQTIETSEKKWIPSSFYTLLINKTPGLAKSHVF